MSDASSPRQEIPRIVSSRWDSSDGHTLDGYRKSGGYEGLKAALAMTPAAVAAWAIAQTLKMVLFAILLMAASYLIGQLTAGEVADLALGFNEMEAALLDVRRQRQALLHWGYDSRRI